LPGYYFLPKTSNGVKLLGNIIYHVFSNAVAILAAAHFISGFVFGGDFIALIVAAAILTAINLILRPILKLILGPIIILTFGLFIIVLNALTLYLLDFLSAPLIIEGFVPLLFATLLFSVVNGIITFAAKTTYRK
jgi:putative membrane protein